MNVLLIAYAFPPAPIVGAFRAAKVAEAFRGAGHQVDVVTARLPGETESIRSSEPGLRVHTVAGIPHPRHLYVWGKRIVGRKSAAPRSETAAAHAEETEVGPASADRAHPPAWKRLLLSMMMIPDDAQGFIPPALLRSASIVRGGIDLIYTTAPPFSDHLVGLLLKRTTGVRWAAEFRDPWSDNPERSAALRSRPADAAHRWLERRCLTRADHVIAVAEATRELLAAKMEPHRRHRAILALNGIDRLEAVEKRPEGPFRIVYTGSFSAGRDPRPFLRALAALRLDRGLTPDDIQVDVIGRCRTYEDLPVDRLARELGIADILTFTDWMPQEWCRERMREADLLLLLFRDQTVQIPNKLFDYLGARRPILAMVDPGGEAAGMLRRAGAHYLVTDDTVATMRFGLEQALDGAGPGLEVDDEPLLEWTTERQMNHLLEQLGAA